MIKRTLHKKEKKTLIKQYNYNIYKIIFLLFLLICLTSGAYAWFYHEYISRGTQLTMGNVRASVKKYDATGDLIGILGDTSTLMYEAPLSSTTINSKFIEITNIGSLDMEYYITFQLDAEVADAGLLIYRVYEITNEVKNISIGSYDTKLKAYAAANPVDSNLASNQANPTYGLPAITAELINGTIELDANAENNIRYYRIDYGVAAGVASSQFNDANVVVHINAYVSQIGTNLANQNEGEIWEVENESQFRIAMANALNGDTIKLIDNVTVNGTVDIERRVHLDTNEYGLNVLGDMVWDFVNVGELNIDVTGDGYIDVGNELIINAPKSNVHIIGENNGYDIYAASDITLNGLQNEEEDGVLLDNVRIIKNKVGNIPADLIIRSNTRLNIGPNVYVGEIEAESGSTNIEIINNGNAVQLLLQDMDLLPSFSKPQIYVYNLNVIQGVVGATGIVLPDDATAWTGPTHGNTKIVNGPNATEISVSGSSNFTSTNIGTQVSEDDVIPVSGESNAYIVYIRESAATLENLLTAYFVNKIHQTSIEAISSINNITKLIIYTSNAQYLENDDFDFMKGSGMSNLSYLDISSARVIDNTTVNQIKANALEDKTTLKTLFLPNTVTTIGDYAFSGVTLGAISSNYDFSFLTIPTSVTSIGDYAFDTTRFIKFEGYTPPTIGEHTFTYNNTSTGARLFTQSEIVTTYQATTNYNPLYIHISGELSNNKAYIVHMHGTDGIGISLFVSTNDVGSNFTIPNQIYYGNYAYSVVCIGNNAFSHITTPSAGTNITMPTTVTEVNSYAFYNIKVNNINLPNTTKIGDYSFYNTNLSQVEIDYATYVGDYAFYNNTNMKYATMERLVNLGDHAFENTDLFEVNLGTVATIGSNVFDNVNYLQVMYLKNTNTITYYNREIINLSTNTTLFNPNWIDNTDNRIRIYVPSGVTESNKSYINLYRYLFEDYEDYVYLTGEIKGNYNHIQNYDIGSYMIRSVTYIDGNGTLLGIEIIDYHGQDLTSAYQIPATFDITMGGSQVTLPVISIGEHAYRHVSSTGAVDLVNSSLLSVGDYSFYSLDVNSIEASSITHIGDYAFGGTGLTHALFPDLYSLGDYALSDMNTLYSVNLGSVMEIGTSAVSNNPNLAQIFMSSTSINDMTIASNAFDNIGTNINSRLRIYVPDGSAYIEYYKTVFASYQSYIYPTGTIVGTYPYLPYNIGAYAIRPVTINNRLGTAVTGWEIIEYHGTNLNSTYSVPTTFTVGDTTYNVISIGDNAYIHVTSDTGTNVDISNNNLLNIGAYAFESVDGINSLASTSLVAIGANAFNESTLTTVRTPKLKTLGAYALANMSTLYSVDLGEVSTMRENSLYNLDNLFQVFFTPTDDTLAFNQRAITNVGSLTNNRIRFYVATKDYYESSQVTSNIALSASLAVTPMPDTITGGNGNSVNSRHNYTVTVRISNDTDYDAASWHVDMSLEPNGVFKTVTDAEASVDGYTVSYSNTQTNGTIPAHSSITFVTEISTNTRDAWTPVFSNCGGTHINVTTITTAQRYVDTYKNLFRPEYAEYFFVKGTIIGTLIQPDIPYNIGQYSVLPVMFVSPRGTLTTGVEFVEYHGEDINNSFTFPTSVEVEETNYPLVKVGDKAFKFATMNGGMTIDIASNNLKYIGEHAFNNLNGIKNLDIPNVEYIGAYAFNGNKLYTVSLDNVLSVGDYAFSNNSSLNYIDFGEASSLGEGVLYNDVGIEQIFFRNKSMDAGSTTMNISIGSNAFYNMGTNIGSRLRIYVPDGSKSNVTYVNAYKGTLPTNLSAYIYATGYLVGSFTYGTLPYDIAQYSVRKTSLQNLEGTTVTGWEIIEYHGDDITSVFELPENITITNENNVVETLPLISISDYGFSNVVFENNYVLELPTGLIHIGAYAYHQRPISRVTGNYIVDIGTYAFAEISNLSYVEFEGVGRVEDYAFYLCPILATTNLGTNVTYIGTRAFYYQYTTSRRELYLDVINPPTTGDQPFPARTSGWSLFYGTYYNSSFYIYVPASAVDVYRGRPPYSDYHRLGRYGSISNIISYSISGGYVYNVINTNEAEIVSYKSNENGTVTIPTTLDGYNVTSIKAQAFDNCTETNEIVIPRYVNKIENGFLSENVSISSISVNASNDYFATNNNDGVLYNKSKTILIKYPTQKSTTSFSIPTTVTMISTEAFANNTILSTITITNNVAVISFDAFKGCSTMTNITFAGSVPYVTGYGLFDATTSRTIRARNQYLTNYRNYLYFKGYTFTGY